MNFSMIPSDRSLSTYTVKPAHWFSISKCYKVSVD